MKIKSLLFLFLFLCYLFLKNTAEAQNIDPQYIFVRKSPMHCSPNCSYLWNFDYPQNINNQTMLEVVNAIGTRGNDKRKLGIGVEINYNHCYNFTRIKQSLTNLLNTAEQNNVPLFINLNGFQWWGDVVHCPNGGRPDLWNWWDPNLPGYNPENKNNVEWSCWQNTCSHNKAWRNWGGGEFVVRPHPNLASRNFIEKSKERLEELLSIIAQWYQQLPEEKKWLLGGIANGTEIDIGANYRVYPDNDHPVDNLSLTLQLGYAAIKTASIRASGGPPTSQELNEVIKRYLNELNQFTFQKGIPRSKIYNHAFAIELAPLPFPSPISFPTSNAALNEYGKPGWSFYGGIAFNPQNYSGLINALTIINNTEWASPEWNPLIANDNNQYQNWLNALRNTLNFRNLRFINISNWEEIRTDLDILNALKTVLNESPSCWVTGPYLNYPQIQGGNVNLSWIKGENNNAVYLNIATKNEFNLDGTFKTVDIVNSNVTNQSIYNLTNLYPKTYYYLLTASGCNPSQKRLVYGKFVVGDFNNDNQIDGKDVKILLSNYFFSNPAFNLNNDNKINGFDFGLLSSGIKEK
ncbi:MAG: hypothetical protein NC935_08840 [Candidatus Omnitrophica bacterium]|nr:hypothetical protein [Candidatus Omnitrophota bacterium]